MTQESNLIVSESMISQNNDFGILDVLPIMSTTKLEILQDTPLEVQQVVAYEIQKEVPQDVQQIIKNPTECFDNVLPDQQSPKIISNSESKNDEYIIAMRMEYMVKKLEKDFPIKNVTKKYFDEFVETFNKLNKAFNIKFQHNKYYDEYHQLIEDEYKRHFNELSEAYSEYEKVACDKYITVVIEKFLSDSELKEIRDGMCSIQSCDTYEKFKQYKNKQYNVISDFIITERISESGRDNIMATISEFFHHFEVKCNQITQLNAMYILNCQQNITNFENKLIDYISKIKSQITVKSQNSFWDETNCGVDEIYNEYINMYIPYSSETATLVIPSTNLSQYLPNELENSSLDVNISSPPMQLVKNYKSDINTILQTNWSQRIDDIKLIKNIEAFNEIIDNHINLGFSVDACDEDVTNIITPICDGNCYNISIGAFDKIKRIVDRCKTDAYYVGPLYMIKTYKTKKRITVFENDNITENIKQLNISSGIYTKEKLPKYLTFNETIINNMFTVVDVGKNKIYIFTPDKLEMNKKFIELIVMIKNKDELENYFGVKITDLF